MAHVPHLYLPGPWDGDHLGVDDEHLHHLVRVLRRSGGSPVCYTDGRGTVGEGTFDGRRVWRGPERRVPPPRPALHLVVAPPTARDRVRFLVEKCAELGVRRISWLRTRQGRFSPPRPERTTAWAVGALEQSRRAWLMTIDADPVDVADLPCDVLVCDRGGESPPSVPADVVVAIGPEGGWATGEIPDDRRRVGLGEAVLRVETAAVAAAVLCRLGHEL